MNAQAKPKVKVQITAICAIALLETVALLMRIDGTFLLIAFAVIGGIAGYALKSRTCPSGK